MSLHGYGPIAGVAGVVLTLFGLVAFFFTGDLKDPYVIVNQGGALLSSLRQRAVKQGLHSFSYTFLFVGVLVMLNFLSTRYHTRWDVTESQVFSLSPQSAKAVAQLQQDLEIYGFFEAVKIPRSPT